MNTKKLYSIQLSQNSKNLIRTKSKTIHALKNNKTSGEAKTV